MGTGFEVPNAQVMPESLFLPASCRFSYKTLCYSLASGLPACGQAFCHAENGLNLLKL